MSFCERCARRSRGPRTIYPSDTCQDCGKKLSEDNKYPRRGDEA